MCWTLRTTSGGNPIGITGLAVMSRRGWRTWARGVRPVVISTTSGETSPTTIGALAAASASLRAGATGHRPRGRHEDARRLPGCRRRARQAVVLEGIGAAFEQAGRVLAQLRMGIRPRPAEAIRAATTNSCSDRHRQSTRTPTLSGGSASADFSASTTERPHEGATDYLHLTGSTAIGVDEALSLGHPRVRVMRRAG